jgi:hypothetical protein
MTPMASNNALLDEDDAPRPEVSEADRANKRAEKPDVLSSHRIYDPIIITSLATRNVQEIEWKTRPMLGAQRIYLQQISLEHTTEGNENGADGEDGDTKEGETSEDGSESDEEEEVVHTLSFPELHTST